MASAAQVAALINGQSTRCALAGCRGDSGVIDIATRSDIGVRVACGGRFGAQLLFFFLLFCQLTLALFVSVVRCSQGMYSPK